LLSRARGKRGKFNLDRSGLPAKSYFFNLYHTVLDVPWWMLFLFFAVYYFVVNIIFAFLYYVDVEGVADAKTWSDCFFFSVQTLDTIGYGRLNPVSFYINIIVMVESWLRLLTQSLILGILFGKLSRASRNRRAILFSSVAVVNNNLPCYVKDRDKSYYEVGRYPCIAIRCGNIRKPQPCEPKITLLLIAKKNSFYKYQLQKKHDFKVQPDSIENYGSDDELIFYELGHELNLQTDRVRGTGFSSLILGIPWLVYHVMDETSPLNGMTPQLMRELQIEIALVFDAIDESVSNNYQARYSYTVDDIIWEAEFNPMICFNHKTRQYDVDFNKLNSYHLLEEKLPNDERTRLFASSRNEQEKEQRNLDI